MEEWNQTAIFNNLDWQVSGVKEKIDDEVREVIWERILSDTGRLQKLLYKAQDVMPGEDTILKYFPRLEGNDPANKPFVTMRVMLGNHPAALAQQTHWDQRPMKAQSVQLQLGSAIIAPFATEVDIYPFSHNWAEAKKFIPVRALIPAGCAFMFSTIAHAGAGVWDLEDASMVRPVPSLDDPMHTDMDTWRIRYQCHVSRGSLYAPSPYSAKPDVQYGPDQVNNLHCYIHFNRKEKLTRVYPPVGYAFRRRATVCVTFGI